MFRKWIVGMVACWVSPRVVNEMVLILVGKGGLYKTSFFQYLLPPELRQYYANDSTADYNNKDFLELCASKALICLDEFETPMGKNLSAFKSIVTKPCDVPMPATALSCSTTPRSAARATTSTSSANRRHVATSYGRWNAF